MAQTSSLVYPGPDGSLVYEPFANHGESNAVNVIPDFSYAGYKGGGVSIPDVPVQITLEPDSVDMRNVIQSAIDNIAALSEDGNGFRGAILFKAGRYPVNGPLKIEKSGIVLRGEGQNSAENGGTELVATAPYQHLFIHILGDERMEYITSDKELDVEPYPGLNAWVDFDVTSGVVTELSGNQMITLHLLSTLNKIAFFASKEYEMAEYAPSLEIIVTTVTGTDSVITVLPSDDTFIKGEDDADTIFGTDNELMCKFKPDNPRVHREIFLKFDLTALDVHTEIKSAMLHLYTVNKDKMEGRPNNLRVFYSKNDNWSEDTLTWNLYFNSLQGSAYQTQRITSSFVPSGSFSFDVENASLYSSGDTIQVIRTPNQTWIDTLQMAQYGWKASSYRIEYERMITDINGNTITINAPIVQAISEIFGGGEVKKVSIRGRIQNCGIENMCLTSTYEKYNYVDENHAWDAIYFENTDNGWARNITARYFGYSCVQLDNAYRTTVQECAMLDPISITTGSRKYPFVIRSGSFNLFQRCFTRGGRHDFVTHSRVAGPNVYVDCSATGSHNDIGPHHRYATGTLFDNIRGGEIRVRNRRDSGTGHGWAGAQTMFWNCESCKETFMVESPIGAMNWGIGCDGVVQLGAGYWESWGQPVLPRSLYFQQLEDRLGAQAVENVTLPEQRTGESLGEMLNEWAGIGNLSEFKTRITDADQTLEKFTLSPNYPNPFNPETTIEFSIPNRQHVRIVVYDLLGKEIRTLMDKPFPAGTHQTRWDGLDKYAFKAASGVYFYRVTIGNGKEQVMRKMMLIR